MSGPKIYIQYVLIFSRLIWTVSFISHPSPFTFSSPTRSSNGGATVHT
jgi:hypothetical protein